MTNKPEWYDEYLRCLDGLRLKSNECEAKALELTAIAEECLAKSGKDDRLQNAIEAGVWMAEQRLRAGEREKPPTLAPVKIRSAFESTIWLDAVAGGSWSNPPMGGAYDEKRADDILRAFQQRDPDMKHILPLDEGGE